MGDGKRLKAIIESKGTNVRRVGMSAGISPTTLYSIIKNDSNIRLDYAIKLASVLKVPVREFCEVFDDKNDFDLEVLNKDLWENNYHKNVTELVLSKFNKDDMEKVDILLRSFYMLNDSAREDMLGIIKVLLGNNNNKDYKRG